MSLKNLLPPLLFIGIGAVNNLVTKLSAGNIDPHLIAFSRMTIAAAVLMPFVAYPLWLNRESVRANIVKLAILGILGFGLGQSLPYYAAQELSGSSIGFLIGLIPLSTIVLSRFVLAEKFSVAIICGALISLLGLVILLMGNDWKSFEFKSGWHEGVLLFAVFAYAAHAVLLRLWAMPVPVSSSLFVQLVFATLFLLPFSFVANWEPVGWAAIGLVVYAGTAATVLAPIIWMHGIKRLGPSRMASYINLIPILTVIGSVSLLGETMHTNLAIGGALVLIGVTLAQINPRRKSRLRTY